MRVLKFRAWDEGMKNMVYQGSNTTKNNGWVLAQFIFDELDVGLIGTRYSGETENIFNFELMQYTGYQDEKWTEIYEGDIVEFIDYNFGDVDYNCTGEVIFEDGTWHITNSISVSELDNYDGGAIRVIGNIYENKELVRCRENERD